MQDLELHLIQLETIIKQTNEPLEGNCFYAHNTFNREKALLPKQRNLVKISKKVQSIMEIGFNGGHSALLFLLSNPYSKLVCFDIGSHSYSRLCLDYLQSVFPNRLTMIWGDSSDTIPKYVLDHIGDITFDLIHIDGGHQKDVIVSDVQYSRFLSHQDTYVIYDDIWIPDLAGLYINTLVGTYLKSVNNMFEMTPLYAHQLCTFIHPPIAICSLALGEEFREITKYSTWTKILYCIEHNYDLIIDHKVYDTNRPRAWSKIRLIQKYLPYYDFLIWIDNDAYIMNRKNRLEHYIINGRLYHDKSMFVTKDWKMINTGVWFIKNCEFSKQFLHAIYNTTELDIEGNWEQTAFIHLYETNYFNAQQHIQVNYHIDINSYWFNYKWGHFILHFCGCRRFPALRLSMESYCPVKRFEETDEIYKARLHWLEFESEEHAKLKLKTCK